MSKLVKDLVTKDLRGQLAGVNDALLVNVVGLDAIRTTQASPANCAARTSTWRSSRTAWPAGPPKARRWPRRSRAAGTLAIVWGAEDIVSLAKEITRLTELKEFDGFQARGGAMDGAKLSAAEVKQVSKWPSRQEQLSLLLGQILSPGAMLAGQLIGMGGALASQIKQRVEDWRRRRRRRRRSSRAAGDSGAAPAAASEPPPAAAAAEMLRRRVDRRNLTNRDSISYNRFPHPT